MLISFASILLDNLWPMLTIFLSATPDILQILNCITPSTFSYCFQNYVQLLSLPPRFFLLLFFSFSNYYFHPLLPVLNFINRNALTHLSAGTRDGKTWPGFWITCSCYKFCLHLPLKYSPRFISFC